MNKYNEIIQFWTGVNNVLRSTRNIFDVNEKKIIRLLFFIVFGPFLDRF